MSQARFCLTGMKKVQRGQRRICRTICTLKRGPCGGRICSRGRGGPPDFPRHRRPRCIAPCGGVVWRVAGRRPAISVSCRRNACRYRDRHERRSSCTAPSRPCTSEPCRIDRRNRECRKLRKRCRCEGSRDGSCAICKPPSGRHRTTGSTCRSFSRRRQARGRTTGQCRIRQATGRQRRSSFGSPFPMLLWRGIKPWRRRVVVLLFGNVGGPGRAGESSRPGSPAGLRPSIPGALDKAAAAAYGVSTARPAGPAAAPARAPGCG